MRLALYIKTLGAEPVPLQHNCYRDYAVALQQQYQKLRLGVGIESPSSVSESASRGAKK